jgi:ribosomal protein S18 acetylase RimI-like enzyme
MKDYKYHIYTPADKPSDVVMDDISGFLFKHLDEYGDAEVDIKKCMAYAMKLHESPGGYILTCREQSQLRGAVIVNKTGMSGYIPENILVYIAVHESCRGQGVGKKLMNLALEHADGDMALHVEANNPAKFLYEKLGFENKYLEMRYKQK